MYFRIKTPSYEMIIIFAMKDTEMKRDFFLIDLCTGCPKINTSKGEANHLAKRRFLGHLVLLNGLNNTQQLTKTLALIHQSFIRRKIIGLGIANTIIPILDCVG